MLYDQPHFKESRFLSDRFIELIRSEADEKKIKKTIQESGVLWAWIPRWLGGLGLHPLSIYSFAHEVSQVSIGMTNILGAHYAALGILSSARAYSHLRALIADLKNASSHEPALVCLAITEPNAGSDFENADHLKTARVMTLASRVSNGYEVSGQKIYVSNAPWAKWMVFSAYADRSNPLESGILGILDLKRKGVSLGKKEQKLGQNLCTNSMVFLDRALCRDEEIFARGSPHFSRFLIEESLAPGRASIAVMAAGVMKSLERFAKNEEVETQAIKNFFLQLQKTHLAYQVSDPLNVFLYSLASLPGCGRGFQKSMDALFAQERRLLDRVNSFQKVHETFQRASCLKAEYSQQLQVRFQDLLSKSSYHLIADRFFQNQLKDARLLEIIEGTTEVCLKDAGVQPETIVQEMQDSSFGFLNPENEASILNWAQNDLKPLDEHHEWVKTFFDTQDLTLEASVLYAIAYESPEKAMQFYLRAIRFQSKQEGIWVNREETLFLSEQSQNSPLLSLLTFDSFYWSEPLNLNKNISKNKIETYCLALVLLGAIDRAWIIAHDYALARYQGGGQIIDHPEMKTLLFRSQNARMFFKNELKTAILEQTKLKRKSLTHLFGLARDTAQVLGGMSYMKEHRISGLYLEIITLVHLVLQAEVCLESDEE